MIDVAVGEEQRGHGKAVLGQPVSRALGGVDQDAGVGEVEAIGVKDSAGEGVDLHE